MVMRRGGEMTMRRDYSDVFDSCVGDDVRSPWALAFHRGVAWKGECGLGRAGASRRSGITLLGQRIEARVELRWLR